MALNDLLFWEKYRPNTFKKENKEDIPIILLPRIRKLVENGIQLNMIFYGKGGQGKSTLAKILTQNTDFRKFKSTERGVENIEIIEEFCKNYSISLRKNTNYGQKVIWLEEFDQTSAKFRETLRSLMEEDRYKENVKFSCDDYDECINFIKVYDKRNKYNL